MAEQFIHHEKGSLHFVKAGQGTKPLLVFHGFGQDHTLYLPIVNDLSSKYTLYIFDLYFHGKSKWNGGEYPLTKEDWKEIMSIFFTQQSINNCALLAFSLGGKFALATLESFPQKITDIFLIAPDGIKTNFWYSLATYPIALRLFFKSMILKPERFQWIVRKLHDFNIVDKGLIRFADYQMNSEAKRKRVYYSWVVFRHLNFNLRKIASLINTNKINITVIVGRYDKVIKAKNMNLLLRHIPHHRLKVVDSGHSGLVSHHTLQAFLDTE